jgi:hypothetical protein
MDIMAVDILENQAKIFQGIQSLQIGILAEKAAQVESQLQMVKRDLPTLNLLQ